MIIRASQDELLSGELVNSLVSLERTTEEGFVNLFCVYRKGFDKIRNDLVYVRKNQIYIIKIPNAYRNYSGILLLRIALLSCTDSVYDGQNIICQNCQIQQPNNTTVTPNVTVNPVVNVSTVDREIELQKLRLREMELQMQADYNKKALRQQKVANAFNGISTFGNLALGTSNQVALWKGKYQSNTNVQTDVWNVGTNPRSTDWNTTPVVTPTNPRPTDWGTVNGTTPPYVPANTSGTTWNTTPATTTSNTGWNTGTTTTTTTPQPGDGTFIPGW
jgi:hypothetical protein